MNMRVPRESIAQWHHPMGIIFSRYFLAKPTGLILTNFSRSAGVGRQVVEDHLRDVGPSSPVRRAASSGDDDATAAATAGSDKSRLTWTRESLPRRPCVARHGVRSHAVPAALVGESSTRGLASIAPASRNVGGQNLSIRSNAPRATSVYWPGSVVEPQPHRSRPPS